MIFGMTYYEILWYFLLYSFGGWVIEVIYHAVTLGKIINRGFLGGPVCPVYGFGVLSVLALLNALQEGGRQIGDLGIFIFGVILATAVELFAGWLLDMLFHARWWDYSDKPFNLNGYICLEFSLIWGAAVLLVVRVIHHTIEKQKFFSSEGVTGWILLGAFYLIYCLDVIAAAAAARGLDRKLRQLGHIQSDIRAVSDRISEYVGARTLETTRMVAEVKDRAAEEMKDGILQKPVESIKETSDAIQEQLAELRERAEALQKRFEALASAAAGRRRFGHFIKAFPKMKHRNYPDLLSMLKEMIDKK